MINHSLCRISVIFQQKTILLKVCWLVGSWVLQFFQSTATSGISIPMSYLALKIRPKGQKSLVKTSTEVWSIKRLILVPKSCREWDLICFGNSPSLLWVLVTNMMLEYWPKLLFLLFPFGDHFGERKRQRQVGTCNKSWRLTYGFGHSFHWALQIKCGTFVFLMYKLPWVRQGRVGFFYCLHFRTWEGTWSPSHAPLLHLSI